MVAVLAVPPNLQFFDDNGDPVAGGFVYTYAAGTLTPKATYTDYTGGTPASNPVELDAAGRPVTIGAIWLDAGGSYKFIVKNSALVEVGEPIDNVTAFNNSTGLAVLGSIANNTIVGNISGGSAAPAALTVTQMQTLLAFSGSPLTTSLSADVTLSSSYQPGPVVAQGSTGTWFFTGTIAILTVTTASVVYAKLWDGTTVIDSIRIGPLAANTYYSISLSGKLATPASNVVISAKDTVNTDSKVIFNGSGESKDSTLTAYRIA